jgi:hypothetical protein
MSINSMQDGDTDGDTDGIQEDSTMFLPLSKEPYIDLMMPRKRASLGGRRRWLLTENRDKSLINEFVAKY